MRDAVEAAFGPLEREDDGRKMRFRLAARGLGNFASAPTAEELAELENAARVLEAAGNDSRAAALRSLRAKIGASLREADRRSPFRRRRGTASRRGLRLSRSARARSPTPPSSDAAARGAARGRAWSNSTTKARRAGERSFPTACCSARAPISSPASSKARPVLFRLDEIHDLEVLDEPGAPPPDFDLKAYAERSFGVFQEEPQDVVLRFSPSAAPDARAFLFHPTQSSSDEPDGSLIVRFRSGGFLEIVHHLMTWGPA